METLQKIFKLLTLDEPRKLFWLMLAIIIMAALDLVGISSILPFLSVVSDPEVIQTNSNLKWLYDEGGFHSEKTFLVVLGVVAFIVLSVSNAFRAATTVWLLQYTWNKHYTISVRLLRFYLNSPYSFFLNKNSSELTTYLITEVARAVNSVLAPCTQVVARLLLTLFILFLLFAIEPFLSILVFVIIGAAYGFIYLAVRKKLSIVGEGIFTHSNSMYKALNEVFGGIKDVKILGKEAFFVDQYAAPTKKIISCYTTKSLISQIPRYAFELVAFGGILLITIYFIYVKENFQKVVPILGLYAYACYRLLPALQQIYEAITTIKSGLPALHSVYGDVMKTEEEHEKRKNDVKKISFSNQIEYKNITFAYPGTSDPIIENFNLKIEANTTVGFVGTTGSGKTTTVDILLGLLNPQQGDLVVDDLTIKGEYSRGWQKNIGYVPQFIFLSDNTISRNIAFGIRDNEIDMKTVKHAARLANIHDFIENELSDGYETEIGERGVRLSGGQRQRLGIARALYHNPSVLVLDEATSSLDGIVENSIMSAIHSLGHKKTIIIIAHRLSTLKECDTIYFLERGEIVDQGSYDDLIMSNPVFKAMASASKN